VLVTIAVLAMTILVIVLYANPLPTKIPSFSGLISNRSTTIYISNEGGDPLLWGQYKILVDNVDETWNFTKSLPDANRTFSLGKVMNDTLPTMSKRVVMVFNTSWGGGTVLLSADLFNSTLVSNYGWYDANWLYRKKIIIDHTKVPATQNDFPVLISLSDVDISGKAQHGGNDILFTSSDGVTKLSHEIESYTWNSGALVAWVKVPTLSSTADTVLYMYYGNAATGSQQNTADVWSNGFQAVWHLTEVGTGTASDYLDSSMHGNNGEGGGGTVGAVPSQAAGQIGNGQSLDGVNDYISTATQYNNPSTFTESIWFKTSVSASGKLIGLESAQTGQGAGTFDRMIYVNSSGYVATAIWSAGAIQVITGTAMNDGNWHYAVSTYSPTTLSLYVDGNFIGQKAGTPQNFNGWLRMGSWALNGWPFVANGYYTGSLDEARYSGVVRSPTWVTTEYNNQKTPGVGGFLVSISSEQTQATMS